MLMGKSSRFGSYTSRSNAPPEPRSRPIVQESLSNRRNARMLEDPSYSEIVRWGDDGDSFVVLEVMRPVLDVRGIWHAS